MRIRPFGRLVPVEAARRRLLRAAKPVPRTETVPLADGLGRVAAEVVRAPAPVPPVARATWDGFAFRSASTRGARRGRPAAFELVGEVYADGGYSGRVGSREAVSIAAGGRLPPGVDTMAIFEETRPGPRRVEVFRYVRPGERIAWPGADFPRGRRLVAPGDVLSPATLGALAAAGATRVSVYGRPRVAILPNGNELTEPGRPLRAGRLYEINNFTLGAVARAAGAVVDPRPPLPDRPRVIEAAVRRALRTHDVVVLTGGSSVGEHDYLAEVVPRVGRVLFHGVAVRPGKPTLAATARGRIVLGMPGHPTSALANSYWLLAPLLRRLGHLPGDGWTDVPVRLAHRGDRPSPDLSTVLALRVEDGWAHPTFHGSHAISSLAGVNAFAILPPGARPTRRGQRLVVHRLPAPIGPA